ncbi:MAG: hypothetical protein K8S94_07410 [Planctomycetia bacterium]|nr:hypothetical protein [Planctomycetia bacterium]
MTEQTYYRWKKKFGGLRIDQARAADEPENLSGETGSTNYPAIGVVIETKTGFLLRSTCCEIAARHICVTASIFLTFLSVVIMSAPA